MNVKANIDDSYIDDRFDDFTVDALDDCVQEGKILPAPVDDSDVALWGATADYTDWSVAGGIVCAKDG